MKGFLLFLLMFAVCLVASPNAQASGVTFRVKRSPVEESGGGWRTSYVIDIGKAPATKHVPMRFIFTRTVAYELTLIDGHTDPVETKRVLAGQPASVESLDVDFSDTAGQIYKATTFDFVLSRKRGYLPGEYNVRLRTSDGTDIGSPSTLVLLRTTDTSDENYKKDIVDRRAMNFAADQAQGPDKHIKRIGPDNDGGVARAQGAPSWAQQTPGEDVPAGSAKPFVPQDAYVPTPEEQGLREHPKGCGCTIVGSAPGRRTLEGLPFVMLGVSLLARKRRRALS